MCVGRKAFRHDLETDDFASGRLELSIDLPEWFETDARTTYEQLIRQMLDSDSQKRPSVSRLCISFTDILHRKRLESGELSLPATNDRFFIQSDNMLGTSVPSNEGFHSLRWDLGLPNGTSEQDVGQWMQPESRERLLTRDHPNTVWIRFCAAWALVALKDVTRAVHAFQELVEALERAGVRHLPLLSAYYGLSWALAEEGKLGESARQFQNLIASETQEDEEDDAVKRMLLSAKSALARNHLLWQPHGQTARYLEQIVVEQTKLLGPAHPETLESQTLRGVAYLLLHDRAATDQGLQILSDVCKSPTMLFTSERPAIVTLCGLCWLLFRTDQKNEALRIFYKTVELQKRHLDKQFPMTAISLEALSNIMPTGPIFWTTSGDERTPNNKSSPYGRVGTLKCRNCRRRKIRVDAF